MRQIRKLFLVAVQELRVVFSRKTYLFFAFVIPIISVLALSGLRIIQARSEEPDRPPPNQLDTGFIELGIVDQSGILQQISDNFPDTSFTVFRTEDQARETLHFGEISAYYLIPRDYIASGEIFRVIPDQGSLLEDDHDWMIERILLQNLLADRNDLADQVWIPIQGIEEISIAQQAGGAAASGDDCTRPGSACESNQFVQLIPSLLVVVFYIAIISSSSMLLNNVAKEKENRTIEILMASINPRQLLAGKTIALGIAGLIQTGVWLASMYILFNTGGSTLNLPEGFTFPGDILAWSLVYFLGGFALYASLMAGAGALVPRMKEAGAASFLVMIPLLFGYVVGLLAPLAEVTNNNLLVLLSLFPLTSPVVMVMRLTDGFVPAWQLITSAGLLLAGAYLTFRSVSAMFHAQNLLSGQPYTVKRYFSALLGRV